MGSVAADDERQVVAQVVVVGVTAGSAAAGQFLARAGIPLAVHQAVEWPARVERIWDHYAVAELVERQSPHIAHVVLG